MINNKKGNRAVQKKSLMKQERARLLSHSSPFAVKEAYVQLRTNMMFSVAPSAADSSRVFAFTSAHPQEGKSLSASNIAISFAMLSKKTLLIDCDMRKPNIHRLWGLESDHGVSNLLTNIEECKIHSVKNLPLDIITAGKIPPNPSELLASPRFAQAIKKFRALYDVVIIDTPPINEVVDSRITAQCVDGVVIVVRSGVTQSYELRNAIENLEQSVSKVCGVLVNGTATRFEKYYNKGYLRGRYGKGKYYYSHNASSRGYGDYNNFNSVPFDK